MIKDGYVVKAWGDQAQVTDVLSSAKPVLSTLLFFAIEEGLVKGVDQPIGDFGWELKEKDRGMTLPASGGDEQRLRAPRGAGRGVGLQRLRDPALPEDALRQGLQRGRQGRRGAPATAGRAAIRGRPQVFREAAHFGVSPRLRAHRVVLGQ